MAPKAIVELLVLIVVLHKRILGLVIHSVRGVLLAVRLGALLDRIVPNQRASQRQQRACHRASVEMGAEARVPLCDNLEQRCKRNLSKSHPNATRDGGLWSGNKAATNTLVSLSDSEVSEANLIGNIDSFFIVPPRLRGGYSPLRRLL